MCVVQNSRTEQHDRHTRPRGRVKEPKDVGGVKENFYRGRHRLKAYVRVHHSFTGTQSSEEVDLVCAYHPTPHKFISSSPQASHTWFKYQETRSHRSCFILHLHRSCCRRRCHRRPPSSDSDSNTRAGTPTTNTPLLAQNPAAALWRRHHARFHQSDGWGEGRRCGTFINEFRSGLLLFTPPSLRVAPIYKGLGAGPTWSLHFTSLHTR